MAAAQYQATGAEDVYPPGAHAISHGAVHAEAGEPQEGDPSQVPKRTADWVQDGEEEQDEAKKARIEGDSGAALLLDCFEVSVGLCSHSALTFA